jgi:hypothetical protein
MGTGVLMGVEVGTEVGAGVAVGNGVAVGIAVSVGATLTTSVGSGTVSDWQPLINANIKMIGKRRPIRFFPLAFFNFAFIASVLAVVPGPLGPDQSFSYDQLFTILRPQAGTMIAVAF